MKIQHLNKGQNVSIEHFKEQDIHITIDYRAKSSMALDTFVLLLKNDKINDGTYVKFFEPQGNTITMILNLKSIDMQCDKLPIVLIPKDGSSFEALESMEITLNNTIVYKVELEAIQKTKAIVLAEMYLRNNEWKYKILLDSYNNGAEVLVETFGFDFTKHKTITPLVQERNNSNKLLNGKNFIFALFTFILLYITSVSYSNFTKQDLTINVDVETTLKEVATPSYLGIKIADSLEEGHVENAIIYKNLADYLNTPIDSTTLAKLEQENGLIARGVRYAKDFRTGNPTTTAGLVGDLVADITYRDITNIYDEAKKAYQGESYDEFTLYTSMIGVALTFTTLVSAGGTALPKVSISILKSANKAGSLSKPFKKVIVSKLYKTVNFDSLDNLNSINDFKIFLEKIDAKPINELFANLNRLHDNSGSPGKTMTLLKYIDNEKDLDKMVKLSDKFQGNTVGVLKVLGKNAIYGSQKIINALNSLVEYIVLIFNGVLWVIYLAFGILFFITKSFTTASNRMLGVGRYILNYVKR
ncbi:MAG: hypothetical protein KU28_05155 [Sulfurovum sp. PC08-66]|nr:MAG: hypothetical protein KU28_05155 [Sulfurovum sp. PC08-66]